MKTLQEYKTERKQLIDSEIQLERAGKLEDSIRLLFVKYRDEINWHIEFLTRNPNTKPSSPLYPLKPNENLEII